MIKSRFYDKEGVIHFHQIQSGHGFEFDQPASDFHKKSYPALWEQFQQQQRQIEIVKLEQQSVQEKPVSARGLLAKLGKKG